MSDNAEARATEVSARFLTALFTANVSLNSLGVLLFLLGSRECVMLGFSCSLSYCASDTSTLPWDVCRLSVEHFLSTSPFVQIFLCIYLRIHIEAHLLRIIFTFFPLFLGHVSTKISRRSKVISYQAILLQKNTSFRWVAIRIMDTSCFASKADVTNEKKIGFGFYF